MYNKYGMSTTHNMKSCSQLGVLPRTAIVVDLTFCSLSVTYVWNLSTTVGIRASTHLTTHAIVIT